MVYLLVTLVNLYNRIEDAQKAKRELQSELASAAADVEEMEYAIENSEDDEVIEDVARDRLGMVKPDEKIFYED